MPVDQNASLRALLGGGQNIANSRIALRNKQLQDPLTSRAFEQQVAGENASEAEARASDPMSQRYADIAAGQNEAAVENVPEIKALHDAALAEKMALATAPARTAGEFAVKAAGNKAQAENDALSRMLAAGVQPGGRISVQGVGSISQPAATHAPSQSDLADRAYLTGLRTGKQHAPNTSFFGTGQKALDAAEIAKVEGRLGGGASAGGPQVGEQRVINGVHAEWDGQGWLPVQ